MFCLKQAEIKNPLLNVAELEYNVTGVLTV